MAKMQTTFASIRPLSISKSFLYASSNSSSCFLVFSRDFPYTLTCGAIWEETQPVFAKYIVIQIIYLTIWWKILVKLKTQERKMAMRTSFECYSIHNSWQCYSWEVQNPQNSWRWKNSIDGWERLRIFIGCVEICHFSYGRSTY